MLSLEVEIARVAVFVNGEEQDDVKESRRCGWCCFEKKVVVGDRLLLVSLECCLAAMATAPFRLSLLPPKPTMLLSVDESIPLVQGEDDDEEGNAGKEAKVARVRQHGHGREKGAWQEHRGRWFWGGKRAGAGAVCTADDGREDPIAHIAQSTGVRHAQTGAQTRNGKAG